MRKVQSYPFANHFVTVLAERAVTFIFLFGKLGLSNNWYYIWQLHLVIGSILHKQNHPRVSVMFSSHLDSNKTDGAGFVTTNTFGGISSY